MPRQIEPLAPRGGVRVPGTRPGAFSKIPARVRTLRGPVRSRQTSRVPAEASCFGVSGPKRIKTERDVRPSAGWGGIFLFQSFAFGAKRNDLSATTAGRVSVHVSKLIIPAGCQPGGTIRALASVGGDSRSWFESADRSVCSEWVGPVMRTGWKRSGKGMHAQVGAEAAV
jgi:hypothetical protein